MSFSGKLSGSARLSAGLRGNSSLAGGVTQSVRYIPGPVGPQGPQGPVGPQGEPGKAFTYSDFTPEQIEALRGPQGIPGPKGEKGDAGQSVTAEVIGESTAGGAGNVVRFYTVAGAEDLIVYNGKDGYTPIKGKDYFDGEDGKDGVNGRSVYYSGDTYAWDDGEYRLIDFEDILLDGHTPQTGELIITAAGHLVQITEVGNEFVHARHIIALEGKDGVDGKNGQSVTAEVIVNSELGGAGNVIRFHTADDVVDLTVYNGKDGYTPIKGKDYFDGADGVDGKDGYTPIKGKDYFDGKDGVDGKDGQSVTAEVVAESTVGGAGNVIRFHTAEGPVDMTVHNGEDGVDGDTPIKDVDYFDGSSIYYCAFSDAEWAVGEIKTVAIRSIALAYQAIKEGDLLLTSKRFLARVESVADETVDAMCLFQIPAGADGVDGKDGVDGYTPVKGIDYFDGVDGYTPVKGIDYFDGVDGKDGKDGVDGKDGESVTAQLIQHTPAGGEANIVRFYTPNGSFDLAVYNGESVSAELLTSTDASGEANIVRFYTTEYGNFDLAIYNGKAGKDGTDGVDGVDGLDGRSVYYSSKSSVGAQIAFADIVLNGRIPQKGDLIITASGQLTIVESVLGENVILTHVASLKGADGYTPVKGKDYYTNAEKAELVDEVTAKVADATGAVGANVAGNDYVIGEETVTAKSGAEIFNDYASNVAIGLCAHAEGDTTTARGDASHSEGFFTNAAGKRAHTEGYYTTASGENSHAEGADTTAGGDSSHAEGYDTTASGNGSHAEGWASIASGAFSHAEGAGTIAAGYGQHVEGRYNIEDVNDEYAHIVGGGARDAERKNIHTVDWYGNAWYAGDLEVKNAVILASPNGTRYKITVSDNGTLSATPVN